MKRFITIIILFLLVASCSPALISGQLPIEQTRKKNNLPTFFEYNNPRITPEDEGDHYPCGYELWFFHANLLLDNGQRWDSAVTFAYFMNKTKKGYFPGISFYRIRHWDRETGKCYGKYRGDLFPGPFQTQKNIVNLTYENSTVQGLYPNYHVYCKDDENDIVIEADLQAKSDSCWLVQGPTNGILPWGISGTGKAYFLPVLDVVGNIILNNTFYNVTGIAYFEHDFGYINFANPFAFYSLKDVLIGTTLMGSTIKWWVSQVAQNRPKFSPSLYRSNDYLLGWCWFWIIFDNNWSIVVFRPTILRASEGLVPAFLYFTKDGQNYTEMGCVFWKNLREVYIDRADMYIPLDFEIIAYRDDIELCVTFTSSTEMTELYSEDLGPSTKKGSCTWYCCGDIAGYYTDKEYFVLLNGSGAIEQSRWIPEIKHRSLEIEFLLPPEGFGFSMRKTSHRLGLERYFKIQLRPRFELIFYLKRVP